MGSKEVQYHAFASGIVAAGSNPEVSPRDLVSSLVSAANRKLRQRKLSLTVESSIPSTVGGPLKPGSRVKDKILAFEGKVGEDSTSKAASNGSLPAESSSPPPPLSAGSSSYPPSPTRTLLGSPPQTPSVCSEWVLPGCVGSCRNTVERKKKKICRANRFFTHLLCSQFASCTSMSVTRL